MRDYSYAAVAPSTAFAASRFATQKNHPDQIQRHQLATEAEHGNIGITKKCCRRSKHQRDQSPKYLDLTLRSDEQRQNYGGHIADIGEVAENDKIKGVDTTGRFYRLCKYLWSRTATARRQRRSLLQRKNTMSGILLRSRFRLPGMFIWR